MLIFHMASGAAAIILGALVYLFPKGTRRHRWMARTYFVTTAGCSGTALLMHQYGLLTSSHAMALVAIACMTWTYLAVTLKVPARNVRVYHHLFGASLLLISSFSRR